MEEDDGLSTRIRNLVKFHILAKQLEDDPALDEAEVWPGPLNLSKDDPDGQLTLRARRGGMRECFQRCNDALEGHRGLRKLTIGPRTFWDLDEDHEGLQQLFADVLPNHPTLYRIIIEGCTPNRLLKLLMEGLATTSSVGIMSGWTSKPPIKLELVMVERPVRDDIARMVRNDAPVDKLTVCMARWTAADVQSICDALPMNTRLRSLSILTHKSCSRKIEYPGHSTFENVWSASSSVRNCRYPKPSEAWPMDAFLQMIRALRVNNTLEDFCCQEENFTLPLDRLEQVCQLLSRHNFTLRRIDPFGDHPAVAALLRANGLVRAAHHALLRKDYRVSRLDPWPLVMGWISSHPSLLYKFLRRGNIDAFVQHITATKTSTSSSLVLRTDRKRRHDESHGSSTSVLVTY